MNKTLSLAAVCALAGVASLSPAEGWDNRVPEFSLADTVNATSAATRTFARDFGDALYNSQVTYRRGRYSVDITFSWNDNGSDRARSYHCHRHTHRDGRVEVDCHG